jgi:hypothetical protein
MFHLSLLRGLFYAPSLVTGLFYAPSVTCHRPVPCSISHSVATNTRICSAYQTFGATCCLRPGCSRLFRIAVAAISTARLHKTTLNSSTTQHDTLHCGHACPVIQQLLLRVAAGVDDEVGTCVRKRVRVRRCTGLQALTVTLWAEVCVLAVHVVVTAKVDQM